MLNILLRVPPLGLAFRRLRKRTCPVPSVTLLAEFAKLLLTPTASAKGSVANPPQTQNLPNGAPSGWKVFAYPPRP